MNNKWLLSIMLVVISSGALCLVWKSKKSKDSLTFDQLFQQAGKPDEVEHSKEEIDQMENSKMVSEGSQFGVQYYNEMAREEME